MQMILLLQETILIAYYLSSNDKKKEYDTASVYDYMNNQQNYLLI